MALNERLAIIISADGKGAIRELTAVGKTAERELGKAGDSAERTRQQLTKIGVGAVTASAVAAVGLYKLGSAASDLEQAVGGAETVFGSASESVQSFSKDAADSFGLSNTAALQLTTQLGSLLQGFGYTEQASAGLSTQLTGLGSDLSAAFGGRPEEAVQALGSALRGEFDPLERYGVSLTAATIAQRAVAMGLATSTSEVDQHAKAQAALAIIYERTAKIQGQFGREADTAAGQLARNRAEFENLKAEVGAGVLPVMTTLLGTVNDVFGAFSSLSPGVLTAVGSIAALATGAAAGVGALSLIAGQASKVKSAIDTAAVSLQGFGSTATALGSIGAGVAIITALDTALQGIGNHAALADQSLQALLASNDGSDLTASFDELARQVDSNEGIWEGLKNEAVDTFSEIKGSITGAENAMDPSRVKAYGEAFSKVLGQSVPQARRLVDAMTDAGWDPAVVDGYRQAIERKSAADRQAAADQREYSKELERGQYATAAIGAAGEQIAGIVGNLFGMGAAARATAADFTTLAAAVNAAFGAGQSSERAALGIANANAKVADAQKAVAGTAKAAGGGMGSAGNSALDAERKTRGYEQALRGVEDAQRAVVDAQDAVPDAERAVADANRGVEDAQRAVVDTARDLADAQQAVVDAQDNVRRAALGVADAQQAVADAQDKVVDATKDLAESEQDVVDAQRKTIDTARSLSDAQEKLRLITQGYSAASQEAADAQEELSDAQRAGERAALAVADAQDRLQEAKDAQTTAVDFFGGDSSEAVKAARDVAKAQLDLQDAQDRTEDTAKTQTEAQRVLNGTLSGFAADSTEATDATKAVEDAQRAATDATDALGNAVDTVADKHRALADANRGVTDAVQGVADANRRLIDAHRAVEDAGRKVEDQQRAIGDADRALEDAHRRVIDATKGVEDANRAVTDALLGVEDANFRVREAEEARTAKMGGGGGGGAAVRDQAQLERDLKNALLDQKDAYIDAATAAGDKKLKDAEAAAVLRNEVIPDQDKANIKAAGFVEALRDQIKTLEPGSPLRVALQEYRDDLGDIPAEISTKISVDAQEASAKIHDFKLLQDDASRPASVGSSTPAGRATGGPVSAGTTYQVGEGNKPELYGQDGKLFLIPGNQGRVTPISGQASGGGGDVHIDTINMGGESNPHEVGRAVVWEWRTRRAG